MFEKMIPHKEGFCPVCENEKFKCAFITPAPSYAFGAVNEMKRHNDSDEVYTLLEGSAVLLLSEGGHFTEIPLEKGCAYRVEAATLHYLAVSEDAKVFVAESGGMRPEHTDTSRLDPPYILQ